MPLSLSNKRTLILGADGFLGRNLCRYLDEHGYGYRGIHRKDGDLRDSRVCEAIFRNLPDADYLFHLVTFQRTGNIQYKIQADLLQNNARIHLNVLDCWRRFLPGAKLVSTGSSCAYPESDQPLPEDLFETGRLHPSVRAYGLAKRLLALGSEAYAVQYGLRYLHCVLATLYGPGDHLHEDRSHFVGALMDRAVKAKLAGIRILTVWGHPQTLRECLYVDDQVEAMLTANELFENTILNCAANEPVTVGEVAETICRVIDWPATISYEHESFQGAHRKALDSSRFLAQSGWKPRVTLFEGLQALYRTAYSET
jgi:GDP-L-fucose synthase